MGGSHVSLQRLEQGIESLLSHFPAGAASSLDRPHPFASPQLLLPMPLRKMMFVSLRPRDCENSTNRFFSSELSSLVLPVSGQRHSIFIFCFVFSWGFFWFVFTCFHTDFHFRAGFLCALHDGFKFSILLLHFPESWGTSCEPLLLAHSTDIFERVNEALYSFPMEEECKDLLPEVENLGDGGERECLT